MKSTFTIAFHVCQQSKRVRLDLAEGNGRAHTNENIRELDISVQNVQCRHVDECIHNLLEQSPTLLLVGRQALVNSLDEKTMSVPYCKQSRQRNNAYLFQSLTFNELLCTAKNSSEQKERQFSKKN